jgi:hypothetical protein
MGIEWTAFLTFDFTDEQWSKLVQPLGDLPEHARVEFKDCFSQYLYYRARHFEGERQDRKRRARLRKKILKVLEDSEWGAATASLEGLDVGADFGKMPAPPFGRMLDQLLKWLARKLEPHNSQVDPAASIPGPKSSQPAYEFIANAAALLEKYGHSATRSEKKPKMYFRAFIEQLCEIADPSITSGTIDEALKRYITRRRPAAR